MAGIPYGKTPARRYENVPGSFARLTVWARSPVLIAVFSPVIRGRERRRFCTR